MQAASRQITTAVAQCVPKLKVRQANTEPSPKIAHPQLADAGLSWHFCAQSIEIIWIATIQSTRFATETS
jgi:hypothetical protein